MSNTSDMPVLPHNVVKYSQVPSEKRGFFTAAKTPKGLLNKHNTKEGTWGVIRVHRGKLLYEINPDETQDKTRTFELTTDGPPGIIEPTKYHRVAPLTDDLEFYVEFYRLPGTGPVDEKRE